MEERQVPGYIMATVRHVMILMTSHHSKREHESTGPVHSVKGDAGYFAT
jgi:hypothetical protein